MSNKIYSSGKVTDSEEEAANRDLERSSGAGTSGKIRHRLSQHKKKVYIVAGVVAMLAVIFILLWILMIRPNQTKKYLNGVWYRASSSSSEAERYLNADLSLESAKSSADSLRSYARRLDELAYEANAAGSFSVDGAKTGEVGRFLGSFADYLDSSAGNIELALSDNYSSINDQTVQDLGGQGSSLKDAEMSLLKKYSLSPELGVKMFELGSYVQDIKLKHEDATLKASEEESQKEEELAAKAAEEEAAKKGAASAVESYLKAFVAGDEQNVRRYISSGYAGEYNFEALKAESRTNYYPKNYRIISASIPSDSTDMKKAEVTASVTYMSRYTDSAGQSTEVPSAANQKFRVIYDDNAGAWKVDGEIY